MSEVFLTILRMGLVSGYTVLVVLLVRLLLRRFPKRYSYLLWSVVLLRLVCPVGIESPFSLIPDALYAQPDATAGGTAAGVRIYRTAALSARRLGSVFMGGQGGDAGEDSNADRHNGGDGGDSGIAGNGTEGFGEFESVVSGNNAGVSGNRPQAGQEGDAGKTGGNTQAGKDGGTDKTGGNLTDGQGSPAADGNKYENNRTGGSDQNPSMPYIAGRTENPDGGVLLKNPPDGTGNTGGAFLRTGVVPVLCGVWIVGVLVFWFVWAYTIRRFKKKLLGAVRVEQGVYETRQVATSFVDGIFHPVIYLATGLTGTVREYVLCHERVHIRRKDPLIKALGLFLVSIYWFHPLIWLAFKKMCEDMEMSCDEQVVERMGAEIKKEYSGLLLCMAQGTNEVSLFASFGGNEVKSRVKNVLSYRKPKTWLAVLLLFVVLAVGVGLGLNPGGAGASAAGGNPEGQTEPDGAGAPEGENSPDGKNLTGKGNSGEQNTPEGGNGSGGNGLSGKEDSGGKDVAEKYASVLTSYHTALKEEWKPGKLVEEGFSSIAAYCYGEDTLDKIGYAFLDLDGDGTEELLIGAIGGDDFIRQQIFELYCLKDGVPARVIEAWERNRYYLCWENSRYILVNESSSSASDGKWSCNVVREGKLFPVQTIVYDGSGETIMYGGLADPEHPGEGASGEDAVWGSRMEAEKEDAQAVIRAYEEYRIVPEYVPFSDLQTTKTGSWEDGNMGKKASGKYLENQLNLILDQKEVWERTDFVAEGTKYTVTDLNGNGRLEIIAASCQGTGHYTYADIYEVSADGNSLVHYKQTVPEGDSQADIIWGVAPVYYNRKENVYRYVFDDLIRNGAAYYYEGKKSLELKEEQVLETTLAYRITEYIDGAPVVAYGGENGLRVTNEQEYQGAADQVFEGWEKGMAYFLWFAAPQQKDDVRSSWYEQLETSYQSFSVVEVSSDKATDKDNSKTKANPEKMAEFISAGGWKKSGKDLEDQLNLILSERPMWELTDTGTDLTWYAITDLDRNGRLELVAAYYGGSGSYTNSCIYEVSEDKNSLAACTRTLSGEYASCPDIIRGFAPMYLDLTDGKTCFIYPDIMRGDAGYVYESKWMLSFGDGHLTEQVLASREAEYDGFTKTTTYRSGELDRVAVTSGAEYEGAADVAFPDRVKGMISIHWIPVDEDFNSGDWYQNLEQSYAGFSFVLPQMSPVSDQETRDKQAAEAFLEQWKQKTAGNGFWDEAEAMAWYETFVRDGFRVESGDSLVDVCIGDFDNNGSKDCFFVMTKRTELTDRPWTIWDSIFYGCMNGESFYKERISEESLIGLSVVAGDFNHDGFAELILSGDTGSIGRGGNVIHRMLQYREGKLLEFPLPEDWNGQFTYRGGFGASVYETEERKKCRAVLEQDGREVYFTITGSREYAPFLDEELPGWRDGKEPFGGAGYGYAGFETVPEDGKEYLLAKEYLLPRAGYGQIGFACVLFDWDENGKVYVKDFYVEPF